MKNSHIKAVLFAIILTLSVIFVLLIDSWWSYYPDLLISDGTFTRNVGLILLLIVIDIILLIKAIKAH
jgi:hypothetical protein